MREKLDTIVGGLISGIIGGFLGLLIFGVYWSLSSGHSLIYFANLSTYAMVTDNFITISTLANILIFFIGIKLDMMKFCKGIMMIIMVSVPLVIWLQMQAGIS
jgi:hypothetical protein|tara:strand:- start:139 stop:447 length:309 start_codon:yes stop_codon:yes gene_type:complete